MNKVKTKYLVIVLIAIVALLLCAGCTLEISFSPPPPPSPEPSPAPSSPANSTVTPIDPDWTLPPVEVNAPLLPDIADVVAQVKPSVVAINTEVVTFDIFNRPSIQAGAGSGWIIDENGLIVTNNHVVEGAKSVTVTMADDSTFPAKLVRTDPLTDLALVRIDAENLPAASIGDSSKLRVGEWVVAIGNPLGLGISAKEGIVSRVDVSITLSSEQTLYNLIETSAAINPGNSGGPLSNMAGEVIGITSAKIATVGVEGMGYAISSHQAMPIIEQLVQTGYVIRPWLGVGLHSVDPWLALRYGLAVDRGAFVINVVAGSPAAKAGLEVEDVIVSFNGEETTTAYELIQAIHSSQIGQEVEIIYWRGETKHTTRAVPTESPPP